MVSHAPQKGDRRPAMPPNRYQQAWTYQETYQEENGNPIGKVYRIDRPGGNKTFRQFRVDGEGNHLTGDKRRWPPYRLPQILNADPSCTVYIVECEKCADAALAAWPKAAILGCGIDGNQRHHRSSFQQSPEHRFNRGKLIASPCVADTIGQSFLERKTPLNRGLSFSVMNFPHVRRGQCFADWLIRKIPNVRKNF